MCNTQNDDIEQLISKFNAENMRKLCTDHPLIAGLVISLRDIKANTWTKERRAAFIKAFESILDYTILIPDDE